MNRDAEAAHLWKKIRIGMELTKVEQERGFGMRMMFFTALDGHFRHV